MANDTTLTSATTNAKNETTYAKLYSTKEAAKFLHMSLRKFQYLTNAKQIQPVQIGTRNTKLYSEKQLLTYAKDFALVQNDSSPMQNDLCKRLCTSAK